MEVFRELGYAGTSMAALTEAMGVNRPSLYAAFGDKGSLFEAAVERYAASWGSNFDRLRQGDDLREDLRRFIDRSVDGFTRPDKPKGCLIWTCTACFGPEGPEPGSALARMHALVEDSLRDRFERARAEGELPEGEEIGVFVRFCVAHLQGLSTLARGGTPREELRAIARVGSRAIPVSPERL